MAKILVFDDRLDGSPPWTSVSATCLVGDVHPIDNIIHWLMCKTGKYQGKDTLYIMAHGSPGYVMLGKDGIDEDNVEKWARLRGRLSRIVILACNVSKKGQSQWNAEKQKWAERDGYMLCSMLAGHTKAYVSAADAEQKYEYIPLITGATFGKWEGNVYTWAPNGSCQSVTWE